MSQINWNNFLNGQNGNQSPASVANIMGQYTNPNQSLTSIDGFGNNAGGPIDLASPNALGNEGDQGLFSQFMKNFKNENGALNFGNIGAGVNMLSNIMGSIMALKQFGMMEDQFDLNKKITTDNHNNNVALAQRQINDIDAMRAADATAAGTTPHTMQGPQLNNSFGGNNINNQNYKPPSIGSFGNGG